MKKADLFQDAVEFVRGVQREASTSGNVITVSNLPDLKLHQEFFPETFYYVTNVPEARYKHISPGLEEVIGLSATEVTQMHMAEFIKEIFHPEDLLASMRNYEKFSAFIKETPLDKIQDIRHISSYRLKTPSGQYRRVLDQSVVIECAENKTITSIFGVLSLSPFYSELNKFMSVVLDSSNGKELAKFGLKPDLEESILTAREIQILRLLALGNKNKHIAQKLTISEETVKTHRKRIMRKLEISNPFDLVWKALELNLVEASNK